MKILDQKIFWVKNSWAKKVLFKKICLKKQVGLTQGGGYMTPLPPRTNRTNRTMMLGLSASLLAGEVARFLQLLPGPGQPSKQSIKDFSLILY